LRDNELQYNRSGSSVKAKSDINPQKISTYRTSCNAPTFVVGVLLRLI
jgi:hypothetical protein